MRGCPTRASGCCSSPNASWRATQEAFSTLAGPLDSGDPVEAWRAAKNAHPAPGTLIATAREQVAELKTFLARSGVIDVPEGEDVQVAPSPGFLRWSSASLWMPGPFESRAGAARPTTSPTRSAHGPRTGRSSTCAT